jgi:hypothetical protein
MSITRSQAAAAPARGFPLRSWRTIVGLTALAGGAAVIAGVFLPWAEAFAGLIAIPGIRGTNGRILLAGGILIAAAGLYHLVRGGKSDRWLIGLAGFAALAFSGWLLLRLTTTTQALSGSMDLVKSGPGLWVTAAGAILAFATLFMPSSAQQALRERPQAGTGMLARAADRESTGARRWLQIALGLIWVLDAALQYQPYMFSKGFVTGLIQPAGMGSPAFVSTPVMSYGNLMLHNEILFNAIFATIQLALGIGLLWRPAVRAALAGTVVWALAVWWVGEGMGMIFSGTASPLTGAPGAALLYALLAVLAWPRQRGRAAGQSVAAASPLGSRWAKAAWLAVWGSAAYFVLQPANSAAVALRATFAGLAAGEPGWIASMDRAVAGAVGSGTAVPIALAVLFAVIAAGIFVPAATRPVLVLAVVTAAAIWVLGENFGGILTGQGTDPNTGPLLILLAAAFWPLARAARQATAPEAAIAAALVPDPATTDGGLAAYPAAGDVPADTQARAQTQAPAAQAPAAPAPAGSLAPDEAAGSRGRVSSLRG